MSHIMDRQDGSSSSAVGSSPGVLRQHLASSQSSYSEPDAAGVNGQTTFAQGPRVSQGSGILTIANRQAGVIMSKIEDMLEEVVDALIENRVLTIRLGNRRSGNTSVVRFPASTAAGARKFTRLLKILQCIHDALKTSSVVTKRNIYYQDPELFGAQRNVDALIDDIASTFGCGRDFLNVVAASKGLAAGGCFETGQDNHGTPIPHVASLDALDFRSTGWILVIEKEATFRSLVASRYFETSVAGPGILVTAKGYPDLASRQFLHRMHFTHPAIPIYALVDFDPDGMAIMRTYKYGSRGLNHEENVTIPGLCWIGVKSTDVLPGYQSRVNYNQSSTASRPSTRAADPPGSSQHSSFPPSEKTLCPLTPNDRNLATKILRALDNQHDQDAEQMHLTRELQLMLMLNMKGEIQAVEGSELANWLDERLSARID